MKLKRSRNLFPLAKYYFRKSEKVKSDQQLFKEAAEKLDLNINSQDPNGPNQVFINIPVNVTVPVSVTMPVHIFETEKEQEPEIPPVFHFILTSDQRLFNRFSDKLVELGAIVNADQFKEVFYGYRGTQVTWCFDTLSLLFMIEFMRFKTLVICEKRFRSKNISICFFDGIENKSFNHLSLNNKLSTNKLTNLTDDSLEQFVQTHKNSNSHRIYRILKEIYGF